MPYCVDHSRPVLVTGASGFVGLHLVRRLIAEGRNVHAIQHRQRAAIVEGASWFTADLTDCDLGSLVKDVETIFHLAAVVSHADDAASAESMKKLNVDATLRLARAAKDAGVSRFVFVSSVAACERGSSVKVDELNGSPVSNYGKSKLDAEKALLELSNDRFAVTVLRPTALFGEFHTGSVQELARAINRRYFAMLGRGDNHVNFLYIEDFVDVITAVEVEGASYGEVFIVSDEPQRLNDFVGLITQQLRPGAYIPSIPLQFAKIVGLAFDGISKLSGRSMPLSGHRVAAMSRDVVYDNRKLIQVLGVRPRVGWREGLRHSLKWYAREGML